METRCELRHEAELVVLIADVDKSTSIRRRDVRSRRDTIGLYMLIRFDNCYVNLTVAVSKKDASNREPTTWCEEYRNLKS